MKRKKWTIEEVRYFVESKYGTLITNTYINALTPLHIKCNKDNYEWYPRWNDVRRGQWCPKCVGKAKKTIGEVRKLVESKNGILLDDIYKNAFEKIMVKCNKDNYEWQTTWHDLSQGYWCMKCAGKVPPTLDEIRQFVEKRNGVLLSNKYKNCYTKLHIRCNKNGHEWKPAWTDIQQGKWCPKCSSGKTQRKLQSILEKILNQKALCNYRGFDWLRFEKKQEVDIYFLELKLAVEYDGEQHFRPINFNGGTIKQAEERFKYIQRLDKNKDRKIKQHSDEIKHFIRFSYKDIITEKYISEKLKKLQII